MVLTTHCFQKNPVKTLNKIKHYFEYNMTFSTILIPALETNYQHLLICQETNQAVVIDPADAPKLMSHIKKLNINLVAIFNTHHHFDHTCGNEELFSRFKIPVYCSYIDINRIPQATHAIKENSTITFGTMNFIVLELPGHTLGQIAFLIENNLYCGDTLFAGGCGKLLEGTAEQLFSSLQRICQLPNDTMIYCGHEYTIKNLEFALTLEPQNPAIHQALEEAQKKHKQNIPTIPTTLGQEKSYNPFLRTHSKEIRNQLAQKGYDDLESPVDVFKAIRQLKDHFS